MILSFRTDSHVYLLLHSNNKQQQNLLGPMKARDKSQLEPIG
jgi:hypothetical protein